LIAAFLLAQLDDAQEITNKRLDIWNVYHDAFETLEQKGLLRRPIISNDCMHNAHMYYILLDSVDKRTALIAELKKIDIHAVFHYVPLHSSPAGQKYGRVNGSMSFTNDLSSRLLRLPLWVGLFGDQQKLVIEAVRKSLS
jgi:dTDP-4-amino-4,6-dideoxygalactose transaminase